MNPTYIPIEAAVALIKSGDRVYLHGGAATPIPLINAMLARAGAISNLELIAISTYGIIDWDRPPVRDGFYLNSLFVSANVREWVNGDDADYVPVFLSEIPQLFEREILPVDVTIPAPIQGFSEITSGRTRIRPSSIRPTEIRSFRISVSIFTEDTMRCTCLSRFC